MKNIEWDILWKGLVIGLIAPSLALLGYYLINYSYMSIGKFVNYLRMGDTYTPLVTLCVLANLLPFYIFLNKEKYQAGKGILAATFIWAAIIVFLKFFT